MQTALQGETCTMPLDPALKEEFLESYLNQYD